MSELKGLCKDCGMGACKSWDYTKKNAAGEVIECGVYYPNGLNRGYFNKCISFVNGEITYE